MGVLLFCPNNLNKRKEKKKMMEELAKIAAYSGNCR